MTQGNDNQFDLAELFNQNGGGFIICIDNIREGMKCHFSSQFPLSTAEVSDLIKTALIQKGIDISKDVEIKTFRQIGR